MLNIDGDTQQRILYDIAGEISVEDSSLDYDDEMLEFRTRIEEEFEQHLVENPDAVLHVPSELPRADGKTKTTPRTEPKKPPGKGDRRAKIASALDRMKQKLK